MRDATPDPHAAARTIVAALAGSAVTVAELDESLRYTAVYSPGALLGAQAALGRTALEIHGPQAAALVDLARRALSSGEPQVGQLTLGDAGRARRLELRLAPLRDERGAARLALLASEAGPPPEPGPALVDSPRLRRAIFAGLKDGLLLLGRMGRLLEFNQHVVDLLSLSAEPQPGQPWAALFPAGEPAALSCVGASLSDGQPHSERVRLSTGQAQRVLDVQALPVRDDQGALQLLLVHIDDKTEQLQIEAQVAERERFVATGRLAATVAHEVNTPLQAIESCLHLAGRVEDAAERARYLRLAREEIKRVGYTMRQLLDLYRPSGARAPLDVNGLIERVLLLIGNGLTRRSIQIERNLSSELPVVVGRADEITQVLINLIFNAMQAMPQGGVLRVESARALDPGGTPCLTIRVRDSGVGIAPHLHEQIFEPFFTTRADGTGLGLAICRRIIEGHGGVLRVESTPGLGSSFIIEIPVK